MSILSLRIRIIAIAVVVLLIIVYLVMSATFHNGYDHSVIAIDDDERIPLWYPHQLVKWCPGGGGLLHCSSKSFVAAMREAFFPITVCIRQ